MGKSVQSTQDLFTRKNLPTTASGPEDFSMHSQAIYAGSFDPWSDGHSFVLKASLEIFDRIFICVAVNPSKQGILEPETRSYLIARSIAPYLLFERNKPDLAISDRVLVHTTYGLVADYARDLGVNKLVRGLRSTSDFEAEFNLYFANHAIHPDIKTWTVMCPPELLHCSSTYVRTVIGKESVGYVGTGFLAQCTMLASAPAIGELFDIIKYCITFDSTLHTEQKLQAMPLQRIFSGIMSHLSPKQALDLDKKLRRQIDQCLEEASQRFPSPFALTCEQKVALFEIFRPPFEALALYLRNLKVPERCTKHLFLLLESPSLLEFTSTFTKKDGTPI